MSSSLCRGKRRLRCLNKAWKSFAKFSKAVKKTSQRMAALLPNVEGENGGSTPPYSSITSLYECPCSYHRRLATTSRDNLSEEPVMVHDKPYAELRNAEDILASFSLVDDDGETEEEDENVGETGAQFRDFTLAQPQEVDEKEKRWISYFKEVDERAELYIKHFWDDQKLQRQRSIEEFYNMLARSA